ncbi:DUF6300 family protein [Actinomadura sp. NPDC047616]|uniref:DUF6300 family protein n=1 Tax=Actinomadura sp. NPDC047616 TaxID=3155914 RepID=UPI0033CB6A8B
MPPCPRCGDQVLLTARMPYPIQRSDGHWVHGTTEVLLCPNCDFDDPTAGALITYFHVHGKVDTDTVRQGADLIRAWIDSNPIRRPDAAAIEAEFEAWKRGEL